MQISIAERIKNYIRNGDLTFGCCILSVIILPVHVYYLPPVMILWVLFWILENSSGWKNVAVKGNKAAILLFLFIIFFLWQILGLILTESIGIGFERLFKRLAFILFPVVLFWPKFKIVKNIKLITRLFAVCTLLYILLCVGNAFNNSLTIQDNKLIFNSHPVDYDYENYFYGLRLSYLVHPSYVAMYIVISLLVSFESLFDNSLTRIRKGLWMAMISVFLIVLYLLSARAGILAGLIILPVYALLKFYSLFPKWIIIIGLGIISIVFVVIAKKNEKVNSSIEGISKEKFNETLNSDPRILIWKSALGVVKENLILGVGTGDASKKLTEEFLKRGYVNGFYDNLNAHNQFLEILLENGLIGLTLFLAILAYMSYIAVSEQNLLLGLFILTSIVFFIFETMLNRFAGVSFFSLFSFLLIYSKTIRKRIRNDSSNQST